MSLSGGHRHRARMHIINKVFLHLGIMEVPLWVEILEFEVNGCYPVCLCLWLSDFSAITKVTERAEYRARHPTLIWGVQRSFTGHPYFFASTCGMSSLLLVSLNNGYKGNLSL